MLFARLRAGLVWTLMGFTTGVAVSYYLYRVGIPITPFVYQAF